MDENIPRISRWCNGCPQSMRLAGPIEVLPRQSKKPFTKNVINDQAVSDFQFMLYNSMKPRRQRDRRRIPRSPSGRTWGLQDFHDESSSGSRWTIYNGSVGFAPEVGVPKIMGKGNSKRNRLWWKECFKENCRSKFSVELLNCLQEF